MAKISLMAYLLYAGIMTTTLTLGLLAPPVLLSLLLPLRSRLYLITPFWKMYAWGIIRLVALAKFSGEDRRDSAERQRCPHWPSLYIGNHQSMMDIPLLFTQVQIPPIMKKEVLNLPVFGLLSWASGAIIVDRKDRNSRKNVFSRCQKRLQEERLAVQYYPEGTRSKDGKGPRSFESIKTPLLEFAYHNGITVYPCSLYGTDRTLSSTRLTPFTKVGIIMHQGQKPKDFTDHLDFARQCWQLTQEGYQELEKKLSV